MAKNILNRNQKIKMLANAFRKELENESKSELINRLLYVQKMNLFDATDVQINNAYSSLLSNFNY